MHINPMDSRLRCWKMFMAVLAAYSSWTYPYEAAFLTPTARTKTLKHIYTADSIVNFFFLFDLALTFFVAYFNPKTHRFVCEPKRIAIRYVTTWFIVDVASILPIELVSYFFNGKYSVYNILGLIRLSRLRHIERFFYRLELDICFSYFWVRCARVLCVILFSIHFHFLKLWNQHEEAAGQVFLMTHEEAEMVFLMIYCGFFKLWLPTYALSNMIALIYMFFHSRTVKPENKEPKDINEFKELVSTMYKMAGVYEDRNMLIHSAIAAAVGNDE